MKTIQWVLIYFSYTFIATGSPQAIDEMSHRTISELSALLDASDADTRASAATCIGMRYDDPAAVIIGSHYFHNPIPLQLPVPMGLLVKLDAMIDSDSNTVVKVSALEALGGICYRTNVSSLIAKHLSNRDFHIRLLSANKLIVISTRYGTALPKETLPTLIAGLQPHNDSEEIWQSAYYLGEIHNGAESAIPVLEKVKKNKDKKVRMYVREALAKIRKQVKNDT